MKSVPLLPALFLLGVAPAAGAQTIPPAADVHLRTPLLASSKTLDRTIQQVVARAHVATGPVTIRSIGLRAMEWGSGMPRQTVRWTVRLGYAANSPAAMDPDPAANRNGAMPTVFDGAVDIPAVPAGSGGLPFAIELGTPFSFDPSRGDLLLEIDEQAPLSTNLEISRLHRVMELEHRGTSGPLAGYARWGACAAAAIDSASGGTAFMVRGLGGDAVYLVGQAPTSQSLAAVGAPDQHLLVRDPILVAPNRIEAGLRLDVPRIPALSGRYFTVQMAAFRAGNNALGIGLSNAIDAVIGPQTSESLRAIVVRRVAGGTVTDFVDRSAFAGLTVTIHAEPAETSVAVEPSGSTK